jgi:cyclophilin family peptidyl-prolyl cis-trans isomerase
MRLIHVGLLALLVLALAACGTPTDNTIPSDNTAGFSTSGTSKASSAPLAEASASPAASTGAATGNQAANTGDPVDRNDKYATAPSMQIDASKKYTATIETTKGTMKAELYAKEAPKTVNNFVFLARENFYQNVKFHRIIKDFMVQTGDPTGTGTGGPGYRFEDEPIPESLNYQRGTLAMANAGPNTNGSQFFIVHADYPLPKQYTIFGKLTEGLDVLDAIANTPTSGPEQSTPNEDVRITNVTIAEE